MAENTHTRISHVELEALCISAHTNTLTCATNPEYPHVPWHLLKSSERHKLRGCMLELLTESKEQWPGLEQSSDLELEPKAEAPSFELLTKAADELSLLSAMFREPMPSVDQWNQKLESQLLRVGQALRDLGLDPMSS